MNTNFFSQIQQLDFTGNLQLTITKGAENNLIVSVLLNNEQCGDSAKNLIPPLTFNATAQEFDEGFFQQINAPIQKVSGLMVDMEKFQKQLDEAIAQSAIEKAKTEKEKKEQEAKDKKFKQAMDKVDELEKEGKFREAWIKVPDIAEYPEKADELRKRKTALSAKFEPDLFATAEKEEPKKIEQETNPDALYPPYQVDKVELEMETEDEETEY